MPYKRRTWPRSGPQLFLRVGLRIVVLTSVMTVTVGCDIGFTPDVTELELVGPDSQPQLSELDSEPDLLSPEMAGPAGDQYAQSGELLIGGQVYSIGDDPGDVSGIELAATEQTVFGVYGYGVIKENPDYRLLWIEDENGVRQHMIVHKDDPLFAGDDGFRQHVDDLESGLVKAATSKGVALGAATTLLATGLGACIPTAGTTCLMGAIGAGATALGALVADGYFTYSVVLPALDNLRADLEVIDLNRGLVP